MNKIKIILADDHAIVRQGLRGLLDQEGDMLVVGEANDGLKLITLAEKLRPDVVIVDLKMPNLNVIDAAAQIRKSLPEVHTVILTMHAERAYVDRAMQASVCGYVLKEEDIGEIRMAIRHGFRLTGMSLSPLPRASPGRRKLQAADPRRTIRLPQSRKAIPPGSVSSSSYNQIQFTSFPRGGLYFPW